MSQLTDVITRENVSFIYCFTNLKSVKTEKTSQHVQCSCSCIMNYEIVIIVYSFYRLT